MTNLEGWDYEFRYWKNTIGFEPVELVFSEIGPEDYSMNRAHVFKLQGGNFASVYESGCSCYSPDEASIEFHPTSEIAIQSAKGAIYRG